MKLWIDCEYNDFQGELISMALVDENGQYWYMSLGCENPSPWVAEHVMPIIGRTPSDKTSFQVSLEWWLRSRADSIHVIADWPEDLAHFCQSLIVGPGQRINFPKLTMEVVHLDSTSRLPHNALADALGLREAWISKYTKNYDQFGSGA